MTIQTNFSNTSSQEHSLSFSQHFSYPMFLLISTPLAQLLFHIDTSSTFIPNPLLISAFFRAPLAPLIHLIYYAYQIAFTTSISCTCDPRHLTQSTSSNGSPYFSLTCIRPPFPYLEHLTTLLLPTFTLNFLLSHALPNLLNSLHNFYSESATNAVSSANNSWFPSNLPQFTTKCALLPQKHPPVTSPTTPSIYIKQP